MQVMVVDGVQSGARSVCSGVPQGSVLGPLLFLALISDIDATLEAVQASSFADDTRVLSVHKETERIMQRELAKIYEWAQQYLMTFNETKFEHLQYRVSQQLEGSCRYLTMDGDPITKPNGVRDLVVIMDINANFDQLIQTMISKARKQPGWILCTCRCKDPLSMVTL